MSRSDSFADNQTDYPTSNDEESIVCERLLGKTSNEERSRSTKRGAPRWWDVAIFVALFFGVFTGGMLSIVTLYPQAQGPASTTTATEYRRRVAAAALRIMKEDTSAAAAESPYIDIGDLVDVVDEAFDVLGVRGVYEEVFGTYQLTVAYNDVAREDPELADFHVRIVMGHQGLRPAYRGYPNDRSFGDTCTGCIWWLRHWLGAMTADKLLRDGFLRLEPNSDRKIYSPPALFEELRRMMRLSDPDILPFHAQHGFDWHWVAATRPDLDSYPSDLLTAYCGEDLERKEYVAVVDNDVMRECIHGMGHAVFYVLALRQMDHRPISVRQQFRHKASFLLRNETICEGHRICSTAPKAAQGQCLGGMHHSIDLFGDANVENPKTCPE